MTNNYVVGVCCFAVLGLASACLPKFLVPTEDYFNDQLQLVTESTTEPIDLFYFLEQPDDVTCYVGDTATFSCLASTTNCTYRWQVYTPTGQQWLDSNINGSVYSPDLSFVASSGRNGYIFRCVVTHGDTGERITSNSCVLTVVDPNSKSNLPVCDPIFEYQSFKGVITNVEDQEEKEEEATS